MSEYGSEGFRVRLRRLSEYGFVAYFVERPTWGNTGRTVLGHRPILENMQENQGFEGMLSEGFKISTIPASVLEKSRVLGGKENSDVSPKRDLK